MSINVVSEIDLLLSNVNIELSSVSVKMSRLPVQTRPKYLPRISILLSTLESLVSSSSGISSSGSNCSSSNLSWDENYDFPIYNNGSDESEYEDVFSLHPETVDSYNDSQEDVAAGDDDHEDVAAGDDDHEDVAGEDDREDVTGDDCDDVIEDDDLRSVESPVSSSSSSDITSDSNTTVEWYYEDYKEVVKEDKLSRLIKFIGIAAPGAVFSVCKSRRRRRRKLMKFVHPELRSIFQHSPQIFIPSPTTPVAVPRPPVPVVDWTKVNHRSLGNLPQPQMFPKHGCSNDPNVYAERFHDRGAHGMIPIGSIHQKEKYPFGLEYGLMTNLGIIAADKSNHMDDPYANIIHGHVWSREMRGWVLYARYSKDVDKKEGEKKSRRRKELR